MGEFIHLHNHTHYSLQDGACTVPSLLEAAARNEMNALALTDHGVMYGVSEFYSKAKKKGIKPIIGFEAYIVVDGSRLVKEVTTDGSGKKKSKPYHHLVLLAKNDIGYKNLCKLSSIGHTEGFYYRPRIDMEVLEQYKDGLVVLSACAAGVVSAPLVNGNYDKAKVNAIRFKEMFGDDFYLEIQDHNLEVDKPILEGMPRLAKELGIKLVATNDIHYIEQEHAVAHNILLLLSDKTGADYRNLRYGTDQVYFKSADEMIRLFSKYPGAVENTLEIAEKISDIKFGGLHFPVFPIPEDSPAKTLDDYFELLAREGLEKRYRNTTMTSEVSDRFDMEIQVIKDMGYSGYFLITQDFINAAKNKGIPVGPGRGSAAGSLVAYALGITNVNPLPYNLLFERFLNPARKSMPDIDIDFADDQRGEVIEYVKNKYGEESVCQIVTFNTLSSRAVLKDVARVLGIPIPTVEAITKHIPSKFGKVFSIEQAINEVPELKWILTTDDENIKSLISYAKILEGMNRNSSKHAAGVVIAPSEVSNYVALAVAGESKDIVTQFNMKELEANAGLLKMDFLGLRTLSIIRDTVEMVKLTRGIDFCIDDIPVDDKETFKLFSKGQTTAVFQFESGPMREYLKKLKAESINDLAAMNALYRPGPMEFINDFIDRKQGRQEIEYIHPVLEPILKETYGVIVYQEQVIQIANKVAGMSLAEADLLRRAMGKKDLKAMAEQRVAFINGAVANNIPEKAAGDIFDAVDKFANYGFNKSHSVAYSIVAYQTAYLKAHFLPEFLAANLTNEFGNKDKVTILLDDCRKLKVPVLPPTVNAPSVKFSVKDGTIIFGMSAIKNVGVQAVESLILARKKLGRDFTSIYDFCLNADNRVLNKRVMEGLVLAGAMDCLPGTREQKYNAIEEALEFGSKMKRPAEESIGLFSDEDVIQITEPTLPESNYWTEKEILAKEREVLGFYLSDHPLRKYELEYNAVNTIELGEPTSAADNSSVRAVGVVTSMRTKIDKQGKRMCFFNLDDITGSCECLMFAKVFDVYGECIQPESVILIKGKLESSGDSYKIHVEEAYPFEEAKHKYIKSAIIVFDEDKHNLNTILEVKKILKENPGKVAVYAAIIKDGKNIGRFFLRDFSISLENSIKDKLLNLLGEDSIRLFG